ncbi:bifunctional phosphoribosylaminoimidazolecarboxamide formyltransferase/IMP cyclohydrolase [Streptococcus pneumoniae]|nr:bifunctional phosphoribosylaminoimidazolecarboxamide formyltransferase/IMP cyclohydrolase [Streptococcus pneumoniae]
MTKRVLISVSDKAGIVEFAQELKKLGWEIISTGGTKVALDNAGVDTIAIDDVTGFPEMMDGRVKTLHPNIHGGLLARRDLDSHLEAAKDNKIELIDLVVDAATAEKMHGVFLEIIIAPSYTDEALAILINKKKNLRILALPFNAQEASEVEAEYTGVVGGLLVQNQDVVKESPADWQVVTKRQPTEAEATALEFAWKAIKYVKSNGIIVTNDHMTLGVGPGQTNRVASVRLAIDQAKDRLDGAVLASDAFFPFADNVEEIAKAGIKAIIQPGGSVRDQESIEAADKYGLTMVFTGVRHFRH